MYETQGFFEGYADFQRIPHTHVYIATYGFRTDRAAIDELSRITGLPIIALELTSPYFYHGDTALCILSNERVMYYPKAFTKEGRALIEALFPYIIALTDDEAGKFAANAVVIENNVIIPKGSPNVVRQLSRWGYVVDELDLSEFLKAGGAAACMRQPLES